jgi:hypothetical protein
MDSLPTDFTVELPKLLGLTIAFIGALLAATTWWRRHRSSAAFGMERSARPAVPSGIVYHDAPTVRVVDLPRTDSQRVDRVRKIVRVKVGEFIDILPYEAGPVARFRITLKSLLTDCDAPAARILVEYGGTTLSCGPLVQELGHNDFVLPRTSRDDPRTSVVYFHERGDTLDFMRIKLRHIDPDSQIAEIDVMQVCGNWPN